MRRALPRKTGQTSSAHSVITASTPSGEMPSTLFDVWERMSIPISSSAWMASGLTREGRDPADEMMRPGGASLRAMPSAIWLRAEFATQRNRTWRGESSRSSSASACQLAEAMARALAPAGTRVSSAGSRPSRVNPLAVAALAELGIDASSQRAKGLDEIAAGDVDAVITLCAEEVCPIFPGDVLRIHWALPDPAAAAGTEEERLRAFREVRDELRRRLARAFGA